MKLRLPTHDPRAFRDTPQLRRATFHDEEAWCPWHVASRRRGRRRGGEGSSSGGGGDDDEEEEARWSRWWSGARAAAPVIVVDNADGGRVVRTAAADENIVVWSIMREGHRHRRRQHRRVPPDRAANGVQCHVRVPSESPRSQVPTAATSAERAQSPPGAEAHGGAGDVDTKHALCGQRRRRDGSRSDGGGAAAERDDDYDDEATEKRSRRRHGAAIITEYAAVRGAQRAGGVPRQCKLEHMWRPQRPPWRVRCRGSARNIASGNGHRDLDNDKEEVEAHEYGDRHDVSVAAHVTAACVEILARHASPVTPGEERARRSPVDGAE